ncbi:MAG: hypothetical protein NZ820_16795, partial [Dehalococcoidia bacterium]|nr:hypothetical protein [Dehalococcoidia bacterium]
MTQQSSAVEAADVSQNDIDFMDTADAVVKSYKASSVDTPVYLYVRDNDLNTTHTGTTEWASTHATETKPIIATSTFTLDASESL